MQASPRSIVKKVMPTLHDAACRSAIIKRIENLRPGSDRRWGKMSVDQMLWHVNEALTDALNDVPAPPQKAIFPRALMKFVTLNLPWPKGAPTVPAFAASGRHDFHTERARCLRLIDALTARTLDGDWPTHPIFGRMSGRDVSRLHAKHLDHHLTQFGV
jgi:hypothetical protein